MSPVGFELEIFASERPQTHASGVQASDNGQRHYRQKTRNIELTYLLE